MLEPPPQRIALVTDFGVGPYIGQMKLLAAALAPALPLVDLIHDLPAFRPDLAAWLLPGLICGMPDRTLYLCVVDPGVGGARGAVVLRLGANWFVGPDNGLFSVLARQSDPSDGSAWGVDWRPASLSASFHGRDLFLPIALGLASGWLPCPNHPLTARLGDQGAEGEQVPMESGRILYVDRFGNLMTGLSPPRAESHVRLLAAGQGLPRSRTFCAVPVGTAFWYCNAFGLVEIAVNQGRADRLLGLAVGDRVAWESPGG